MGRVGSLPLVLAATAFSGLGWACYVQFGHLLVIALYDGQMPVALLNQIIKKQAVHPLHYYLDKADAAARGFFLLIFVAGLIGGAYKALVEKYPGTVLSRPLAGGIVIATSLFWASHLFKVPLLQILPYWFWSLHDKPLPWIWLCLPLALMAYVILGSIFSNPTRHWRNLALVALLGFALQHGFALMEGRGLAAMSDRIVLSGHTALARAAVEQESFGRVLGQYETLLQEGELPPFPHATKPPGLLLFLMAAERVTGLFGGGSVGDELDRLATFATLVFPLLSYLTLVPLYFLCRLYAGAEEALVALVLFATMPNTALITLHADQYLYPFLGVLFVYVYALAASGDHRLLAALAGVVFYLALLASFALVALAPLVLSVVATGMDRQKPPWSEALRVVALCLLGFALCHLVFWLAFDYDVARRYRLAMAAHQAFKVGHWHLGHRLYFGFLNSVEFAVWCGLPVAILCGANLQRAVVGWRRSEWALGHVLAISLVLIFCALVAAGKTAAETGRLWLFLVPLVAICGARELRLSGSGQGTVRAVVLAQLTTILVLKSYQDFF